MASIVIEAGCNEAAAFIVATLFAPSAVKVPPFKLPTVKFERVA